MRYAMTFDNSREIMTEDEMHDVNGGGTLRIGFGVMLTPGLAASLLASALIQTLTNKVMDSLGNVPYHQMFYVTTSLRGWLIPNGNVVLNLGSLGF